MITIKVVGGLGNQLFGYFACRYFHLTKGVRVRYDISDQLNGLGVHNVTLRTLNLPGKFGAYDGEFILRVPNVFMRRIFRKFLRTWRSKTKPERYFVSRFIGFDNDLENMSLEGKYLSGYFQSARYFQKLEETIPNIKNVMPKEPSEWFAKIQQEILEKRPIVLHVRRGDYMKHADTYGLLSENYFVNALEQIRQQIPDSNNAEVWVFTDSFDIVKYGMPKLISNKVTVIEVPIEISDSEVLIAMSLSDKIVISNSTFSWWAATLNSDKLMVVAPSKWYKNMDDPCELFPNSWARQTSLWV